MKKENDLKIIQGWSDEKIKAGYEGLIKLVGENKHLRQFDSASLHLTVRKQFNDMFNDLREKLKSIDWDKVKEGARRFDEQHKRIKNGYLIKGKNLSGYLHKNGLIPTDGEYGIDDFLNWFYRAYGRNINPMPDLEDRHILEYSIQRKSNLDKDLIFIKTKGVEGTPNVSKKPPSAAHYALTYIFDCDAEGVSIPYGEKKKLEEIGSDLMGEGKGNTFYKNVNNIQWIDRNKENNLIEIAGCDWKKSVLSLSKNSKLLRKYLENKKL